MSTQPGVRRQSIRELIELGPAIDERMALETEPNAQTVAFYALTRGAEQAWQAIDLRTNEAGAGALFWIGGPAGSGKTHFLNYALALDRKAGPGESPRRVTLGFEIGAHQRGENLETQLIETLAREIGGNQREAMLWRQMGGADALKVALSQAHRLGAEVVTIAIDFGAAEHDSALGYLETIAKLCGELKRPRPIVIAAGRGRPPSSALAFDVAPADGDELAIVAILRARRVKEEAKPLADGFYRALDTGAFDARAIFPFHPLSVKVLRAIASPPGTVAEMARLVRDVLAPFGEGRLASYRKLIVPAELTDSPAVCARIEARLGEEGRAALKTARGAIKGLNPDECKLAAQIIDTLVLAHFDGGSPRLNVADLRSRLPHRHERVVAGGWRGPRIAELLSVLAERAKGAIRLESDAARFDPRGAGAPEVAAFNAALPLVRRFDPAIVAAQEMPELKAKLKRLSDAMANALEVAHRTGEVLAPVLEDAQTRLPPERQTAIADFIQLASAGPAALLEAAADPKRREEALKSIAAFEALAAAAAVAPRLAAMRNYLQATGLKWAAYEDQSKSSRIAALESQCQLLGSQLNPAVLLSEHRNLEALQARFQQFRWSYVDEYRAAHEQWREEMTKLAAVAEDARRHIEALCRLNSIAQLGPAAGEALEPRLSDVLKRIGPCDFEGPLSPEINPRCAKCGFVLGTPSPKRELNELLEQSKSALRVKLAALSKNAIARLIREHDHTRRLEGFLRIIQASQTEALVRVLDDKLAGYLARLVDEISATAGKAAGAGKPGHQHGVVRRINAQRSKGVASKLTPAARQGGYAKAPPR